MAVNSAGRPGEQMHPSCVAQSSEMRLHGCFMWVGALPPPCDVVAQSTPTTACPVLAEVNAIARAAGTA